LKLLWSKLRFLSILLVLCTSLFACVAPALLLAPQSQIMWALLKPLVGLDPKEANLFKQPMIQSRLEPLLGHHYGSAVQLLETADKIQQEGPLFYVVSKYTPVPELAEKAGFVWNSETNQMAVMLVSGGAPQIFAEKLNAEISNQVPLWPAELSDYTDPAKLRQQALDKATEQVKQKVDLPDAVAPIADAVKEIKDVKTKTTDLIEHKKQAVIEKALSPVTELKQQANQQILQQTQQLKQQTVDALTSPVTAAASHAKQQANTMVTAEVSKQTPQLKNQSIKADSPAVLEPQPPATPSKPVQIPAAPKKQAVPTVDLSLNSVQSELSTVKPEAVLTIPAKTGTNGVAQAKPAAELLPEDELISEDDLAAELATEQQSLKNDKSQQIIKLQQDIDATTLQLKQASSAEDINHLQQKLQQLSTALKLLKAGH